MDAPPVQYAKTSDGYNIAYTVSGEGRPLILLHQGFTSVQFLPQHYPDWFHGLTQRFRMITFDNRGEGLSTRGLPADTREADFLLDIDAIADRVPGERFVLFAFSLRGHEAVRFALAHPDRVEAIVWCGAGVRETDWPSGFWMTLPRENWQMFLSSIVPRELSSADQRRRAVEYGSCCTFEEWNTRMMARQSSDVEDDLRKLETPLLVLYPRSFPNVPIERSAEVAALAPNARLFAFGGDSAWGNAEEALAAVDAFLADLPSMNASSKPSTDDDVLPHALSDRQREVLRWIGAGKTNREIAEELVLSERTVERHVADIYAKTGLTNRAQAAIYAREQGLI